MYFAVGVPGDPHRRLDMCVFPFSSIDNLELLNRELLVLMMPQLRGKSSPELQFFFCLFFVFLGFGSSIFENVIFSQCSFPCFWFIISYTLYINVPKMVFN